MPVSPREDPALHHVPGDESPPPQPSGCLPAVLRVTWMLWGNLVLFLLAAKIAEGASSVAVTALFFLVAVALVVVRRVDITRFEGRTSDGEPATLADWRRYAIQVALVSAGLWGTATLIASGG